MNWHNEKWEFGFGFSLDTWALPVQVSFRALDFGRRWGFGIRVLCFTLFWTKDFCGYAIVRKPSPVE